MDDHFRPIKGFPGYRVSKVGVVQSCWSRHARPARMTGTWLPLSPIRRRWGHLTVNLSRAGKKTSRPVHRLVLEAWVGPCPEGLIRCHNNGLPWDNRVENLRRDTYQANSYDSLRHGTRATGSRCRSSKLAEDDVQEIRRLRAEGVRTGELARRYGVTRKNIEAIVYRRSWRHLPYPDEMVAPSPPAR
jgi:hypothetical protein